MRLLLICLLLVGGSITAIESFAHSLALAGPENPALYADFDNKTAGQPIAARGGAFGEPMTLSGLDAEVVEATTGQNVLRISDSTGTSSARRMRWQIMGNAELNEGEVRISLDLTASALDRYSILVRETGTSSNAFLTMTMAPDGVLFVSDANGSYLEIDNAYAANVPLHMDLVFDMDARTSSLYLNGSAISSARLFGASTRGIGSVLIGYSSNSNGSAFDLDNLTITGSLPFPVALEADFDDKTAGSPIGLGGAALNEPHSISAGMQAIVFNPIGAINILDMTSTNTATGQSLRWQFLDNLEVRSGLVVVDFELSTTTRDQYSIGLREPSGSSKLYLELHLQPSGEVWSSDGNGYVNLVGVSYNAGQIYRYRIVQNLDAGIYDIFRDGVPLLRERAHGISGRGLGGFLNGIYHNAQSSAHLQIDSLRVYASNAAAISSELIFLQEATSALKDEPVAPAIEVAVMNILDTTVPDGTAVTLEISPGSGPTGATIDGAAATTVAGVARFTALTFDTVGTYRLLARSLDASAYGTMDIVVTTAPTAAVFVDGFE